jgi:glutamine amidotransferase
MIAVIDSGVGNIRSVANALTHIKADFIVTKAAADLKKADKIIFPGVGAFCDGMKAVHSSGFLKELEIEVLQQGKLYLGICLGMQLLAEKGFEDGEYHGLGWIKGKVRVIKSKEIKLPHIGWNDVTQISQELLFDHLDNPATFYFVHSYIFEPQDTSVIAATCEYGEVFCASLHYKNIYGVQFHPEKSQQNGLQLLKNFVTIKSYSENV